MTMHKGLGLVLAAGLVLASTAWLAFHTSGGDRPGPSSSAGVTEASTATSTAPSSAGQAALEAVARQNRYLFMLWWKEEDPDTRAMRQALDTAIKARWANKATVAQLQVTDPAEKALVDRYGLSRSPMPLVLAIAPNGAITGGFPTKVTEQDLASAFVSPGMAGCLKGTQARKLVLLCVQPKAGGTLPAGVRDFKADGQYGPHTEIVTVKADDPAESEFLQSLELKPQGKVLTALLAPPGSMLGAFEENVTKEQLVERLSAAQGACAGGQCGPGGCGPR